jgi:hypothetical protein
MTLGALSLGNRMLESALQMLPFLDRSLRSEVL